MVNTEYCTGCGVRINENRGPNDKPSARIVCDNCYNRVPCSKCNKALEVKGVRTDGLGLLCSSCNNEEAPLLVIEVKDLNSLPTFRYKGEVVTGCMAVDYRWRTKGINDGEHRFKIEHAIKQGEGNPIRIRKLEEETLR